MSFKNPWDANEWAGNEWESNPWANEGKEVSDFSEEAEDTPKAKEVFLTFDDGLQHGTYETLRVLKEHNIKATYFLTGIHIKNFLEKEDRQKGLEALRHIFNHHHIANHSYSHANDFYSIFYEDGLIIGKEPDGQSKFGKVVEDFQKNEIVIKQYLSEAGINLPGNYRILDCRFPGRNTWHLPGINDVKADTLEETNEMVKLGYRFWGWDTEWSMNFFFARLSRQMVNDHVQNGTMDWTDENKTHPHFDLHSEKYIDEDRLKESWEEEFADIMGKLDPGLFTFNPKKERKVIVLMHERAFRLGKKDSISEPYKLYSLIEALKKEGVVFKTIADYL